MREDRFIIKVVEMYYKQGLSQVDIGKRLNVSRTTISRALTRARKEGYVEIKINYPEGTVISKEEMLEKKYNLKEAAIACTQEGEDIGDEVAFYASDYLLRILKNHMTVAMTRGETIYKMISCLEKDVRLKFLKLKDLKIVTLMATTNIPANADRRTRLAYSNYLIEETARALNGSSFQMFAPQYVDSPEAKKFFLNERSVKEVITMAGNADVALVGIGTVDENSAMVRADLLSKESFEELKRQGGQGEILSHIIDADGNQLDCDLEDRLISLELEDLKKIPIRVGVAYGIHKKDAILAALKKNYINVLITDDKVAEYLLEY